MTTTTVSHVAASARGVIVVCFTEWKGGQALPAHCQVGARYLVIDVNGPPIVRFRGDSPAEAWHFVDSSGNEFVEAHEQALDDVYLEQAFKGQTSGKPGSGEAAGRVAIIDRDGGERERQFVHSWVVVSRNGPAPEDAGLTILFGAESLDQALEPAEDSSPVYEAPKRRSGPRP